jgi:hypothetical protein
MTIKLKFHAIFAIAALSLLAKASTIAPRSEVIDNALPGKFVLDDRPLVLIVVDERILSFDKTRELMLEWFSKHSYQRIILCNVEATNSIKHINYDQIYCFGRGVSLFSKGAYRPIAWYFVLPTIDPPSVDPSVLIGVVLGDSGDYDAINRVWRQWCKNGKMPWSGASIDKKVSVSRALSTLSNEIEKLRIKTYR